MSTSRTGLFEREGYGEIWYEIDGRRAMLRSTTEPIVLAHVYQLAGVTPPPPGGEPEYPGYPLAARPVGAAILFFGAWPLAAGLAFFLLRGQWRIS